MINRQKIKKLAYISAQSENVPKDIEKFVLTRLTKHELKDFLKFYKIELDKKRVYVISSESLSKENLSSLKKQYDNKDIIELIDETLGAGIMIKDNDLVIDYSFKNYILETVEKIKN